MSDRAVHPLQAFSAADAAKGAASAPGDVEADGSGARPAPVSCCCLCCRRTTFRGAPLTRRLRRRLLLASLLAVALCVAGAALGLYYGVFLKSTKTTPLRVTKMPTGPGAALGRRRRRLASVPGAAVASSTATAYAQARAFGPVTAGPGAARSALRHKA